MMMVIIMITLTEGVLVHHRLLLEDTTLVVDTIQVAVDIMDIMMIDYEEWRKKQLAPLCIKLSYF